MNLVKNRRLPLDSKKKQLAPTLSGRNGTISNDERDQVWGPTATAPVRNNPRLGCAARAIVCLRVLFDQLMKLIPRFFPPKIQKRRFIRGHRSLLYLVATLVVIAWPIMVWTGHEVVNETTLRYPSSRLAPFIAGGSNRQVDDIQIHVIGWSRPESMDTLLRQLEGADYNNWHNVTLYIHLDGDSPKERQIDSVVARFDWTHGPKITNKQQNNVGLRGMWLDSIGKAARASGDNTLLVVFEDDIRVSREYFQWLLAMIDRYATNPKSRDSNLVGFSLSPILLQEMTKPFTRWDAREAMGDLYHKQNRGIAYLTTVPSSWGAAYWSNHWNDFDAFVRLRMQSPFYDIAAENAKNITDYSQFRMSPRELHIPGARANVWPKSWKRFMVDFMYARGLVMMYPNLPGNKGLATTLHLTGEHVSKPNKHDPRVASLLDHLDHNIMTNLPRYKDLPVFGLTLLLSTREELMHEGSKFLHGVRKKWLSLMSPSPLYEDLIQQWARPGYDLSRANDDYCVADLYTSTSAMSTASSHLVPSTSKERYLLFEPQYGVSNQLETVIAAYYWARVLGRRLVLPPLVLPRVSDSINGSNVEWLELANFFDFSNTDKDHIFASSSVSFNLPALKPISFTEFSTLNKKPWRLLKVSRDAIFDKSARILTSALHKKNIELVDIQHLFPTPINPLTVRELQQYLGGCNDAVLAFDGLLFTKLSGVGTWGELPQIMLPRKEVTDIYSTVKSSFLNEIGTSEYACYHARLGDFVSMCNTVENKSSGLSLWYRDNAKEFKCVVTPEELASTITKNGYPAFVMSDKASDYRETLDKLPIKTLTSDWVSKTVKTHLLREASFSEIEMFSLIIDQTLCSDAKVVVLNKYSTLSRRVMRLRQGKDYEYWRKEVIVKKLKNLSEVIISSLNLF